MRPKKMQLVAALIIASIFCVIAIFTVDAPVARFFESSFLYRDQDRFAIGAHMLLTPLTMVAVCCLGWIILRRKLSKITEVILLACISAVLGFLTNNFLLKPLFGRRTVDFYFVKPEHSGFFPFEGNWKASFPSGHMVIVTAVIAVLWYLFPRFYVLYVITLVCAASLLVAGEWHFVSDTIAGVIWGSVVALFIIRSWRRLVPRPIQ